jgi:hypothetical protein
MTFPSSYRFLRRFCARCRPWPVDPAFASPRLSSANLISLSSIRFFFPHSQGIDTAPPAAITALATASSSEILKLPLEVFLRSGSISLKSPVSETKQAV